LWKNKLPGEGHKALQTHKTAQCPLRAIEWIGVVQRSSNLCTLTACNVFAVYQIPTDLCYSGFFWQYFLCLIITGTQCTCTIQFNKCLHIFQEAPLEHYHISSLRKLERLIDVPCGIKLMKQHVLALLGRRGHHFCTLLCICTVVYSNYTP